MSTTDRRDFLKTAGVGVAAIASTSTVSAAPKSAKVVLGIIGPGGMGMNHVRHLCERDDVTIAWVCDVDESRLAKAAEHVKSTSNNPNVRSTNDLRHVLDDPAVDAVFIATPDHWHAPAAILSLNAGKHVYVEKPCCHNIREGRLMADAVERSGKLLQVGTQSRSTEFVAEAIQRIREGEIGEVLVAKAWNSQRRGSIGKSQPTNPPEGLDFDTWVGPAPMVPFQSNLLHSIWRWWYAFGCGDLGNDGVHDLDVALWGLNPTTHPERVTCLGGKYYFDDDQQFPDTQYAVCEYAVDGSATRKKQLIFEQRIWSPYRQEMYENGAAYYGTDGYLVMGHTTGWRLYKPKDKLVAERTGKADLVAHHDNFLNCVRGDEDRLNADIRAGHLSATVVHLANIAARTRSVLEFDTENETITNDTQGESLVARQYREGHWAVPG
ncbi:MAG: Gfo/Idh/MocA family oxidoreductase [Planctomycetaceae bacterium]|nr:Gfo/Idh/MocA family oxidoreductase [Planctomycetaceae bacterium]